MNTKIDTANISAISPCFNTCTARGSHPTLPKSPHHPPHHGTCADYPRRAERCESPLTIAFARPSGTGASLHSCGKEWHFVVDCKRDSEESRCPQETRVIFRLFHRLGAQYVNGVSNPCFVLMKCLMHLMEFARSSCEYSSH